MKSPDNIKDLGLITNAKFSSVLPEKHIENPVNAQQTGSLQVNHSSYCSLCQRMLEPVKI